MDFGLNIGVDDSAELGMGIWGLELDNLIENGYGMNLNNTNGPQQRDSGNSGSGNSGIVAGSSNQPTQINTLPFLVGSFRAPIHGSVKQVLDTRLSGLLCMVHKIQQYTQQRLGSLGRAKLSMIRETDQRLA